jgi:hypothetical protein
MTEPTEATPPPKALRAAVGVWLALGVFGLLNVVYLWFQRNALRDEALRRGLVNEQNADSTITTLLVQLTATLLLFAVGYTIFAWFLRKGHRWARIALSLLAGLHLLWVVLLSQSPANLVSVLLMGIGFALTWRPTTSHWLKEQQ